MRVAALVCLALVASGCRRGVPAETRASLEKSLSSELTNRLATPVTVQCPALLASGTIECAGETEAGPTFTIAVTRDGDEWIPGEVRGLMSGGDAAKQIRATYRDERGIDLSSLHCPALLAEGEPVACRAHADTLDFEIRATVAGTRLTHETDGLVDMSDVEASGVALFETAGAKAVVDCGNPRARVKRIGLGFSCSAVVDGQSAFVDVVIADAGPKLAISGWQR